MDVADLNSSLTVLLPVAHWNYPLQLSLGSVSMVFCLLMAYIVAKNTPDGFSSTKIMLLVQLFGCFLNSLLYGFLQPFPVFPHKVLIFTGPFRTFGSKTASIIFTIWITNLSFLSCNAIIFSFNYYIETMDTFKQKNIVFEFFRNLSKARRVTIYSIFTLTVMLLISLCLYYSIDDDLDLSLTNGLLADLRDERAMILGGSLLVFFLIYCFLFIFLRRNVRTEMEELRPSVAPRTFEILEQLLHLLILIDATPIALFFLPTGLFISLHYFLPFLVSTSCLQIFFNVFTDFLFALFSYTYYLLLLFGFKYYRRALLSIVCRPVSLRRSIVKPSNATREIGSVKSP